MTDYVLKATYFDQAVERDEKGLPTKIVKHAQGAVISDLDEAEATRLLGCGAVVVAEVQSAPPAKPKRARRSRKSTATAGKESDQSNADDDTDGDEGGDDLDGLEGDEGDDDGGGSGDDEGAAGDAPADAPPKGTLPKPPNTADLELWVAYAVDQGLNEDEAKGMDRAALIKALA
ncbi:hypothetical protein [Williamsia sp.]|uniref:hypothetical protein n=1 Tax=Williamsia sp. TaxID=1872085 RepID=UPI002F91FD81